MTTKTTAKRVAKAETSTLGAAPDFTSDSTANNSDVAIAAALPPSPRSVVRRATSKFVDLLAHPQLQQSLVAIEPDLSKFKAFRGQNVKQMLALVKEGQLLNEVADRMDNATARVHQRIVVINHALHGFETSLAQSQESAEEGSAVATALAGLVRDRAVILGRPQAVKTRARNARAKKAGK